MAVQLSAEATTRLEAIVAKYPRKQAALLPALHLAQEEFGHLSTDVQLLIARTLGVPPVLVHEVTTFYEMYHQHPEGQFHLEICTNISCHLAGADRVVGHVKKALGIEVGHQTEDGLFGLMESECLASCGSGPMMRVGRDYYEYLTPEACDHLIAQFRSMAPQLDGKNYAQGPNGPHVGPVVGFEPRPLDPKPAPAPAESTPPADAAEATPEASESAASSAESTETTATTEGSA